MLQVFHSHYFSHGFHFCKKLISFQAVGRGGGDGMYIWISVLKGDKGTQDLILTRSGTYYYYCQWKVFLMSRAHGRLITNLKDFLFLLIIIFIFKSSKETGSQDLIWTKKRYYRKDLGE
jgi:hypothetical protein